MATNTTLRLSEDQIRAVAGHPDEPVPVVDPATNRQYVLLPADLFHRVKALAYDDSPWTDEEMDLLAAESAEAVGWEGMDAYQDPTP